MQHFSSSLSFNNSSVFELIKNPNISLNTVSFLGPVFKEVIAMSTITKKNSLQKPSRLQKIPFGNYFHQISALKNSFWQLLSPNCFFLVAGPCAGGVSRCYAARLRTTTLARSIPSVPPPPSGLRRHMDRSPDPVIRQRDLGAVFSARLGHYAGLRFHRRRQSVLPRPRRLFLYIRCRAVALVLSALRCVRA